MTRSKLAAASAAVLVGLLGAGCTTFAKPAAVTTRVSAAPKAQLVLKPAAGKAMVTIDGLVNEGHPVALDLASFDALPTRRLTIVEPFVKKSMTFTGVFFADLMTAAKATGKTVVIHALDDFQATLALAALQDPGVLLATRSGGETMAVKAGGPVRLVFPPSSEAGKNTDHWVWSIDRITVR